jgi:hypothetical protein
MRKAPETNEEILMKNQICTALMTLGLAGTFGSVLLTAQDTPRELGTVPFAFQVGDKIMPAGTYAATEMNANGLMQLTNQSTRESILVAAFIPKSGKYGQSKLTFNCYGGHCFLSEIWYPQESVGHAVKASRHEKEMAANSNQEKQVYVAMR